MRFNGELLKERRKELGFTLDELADLTQSSKSYIWECEKGTVDPSGSKVLLFSRALGMAMESFYGQTRDGEQIATRIGIEVLNLIREFKNEIF